MKWGWVGGVWGGGLKVMTSCFVLGENWWNAIYSGVREKAKSAEILVILGKCHWHSCECGVQICHMHKL